MLTRLVQAHGWRYVLLIISVYGMNQGMGEGLTFFAQQYWMTDPMQADLNSTTSIATKATGLGLSPARYAEVGAITSIPWQIKSLYGIASDLLPLFGLHRTPYMVLSSLLGLIAYYGLWRWDLAWSVWGSTVLLFLAKQVYFLSIATPDVMVDASIAQKASADPSLASDLQALCWVSFGAFKILALLIVPKLMHDYGTRFVFGAAMLTSLFVTAPALLNWLGEVPRAYSQQQEQSFRERARAFLDENSSSGPFVRLSLLLTALSLSMGLFALVMEENHAVISLLALLVITPTISLLVYYYESRVDARLAKFSLYIFLAGAIQPSSPVLFYWMKADEENCSRALPCFTPDFISTISLVGYVCFILATLAYNRYLTAVSYRTIYATTQCAMFALNLIDLFWVKRLNITWFALSDKAFVLGDEVIAPMISRWNTMPMLILASQLCPSNVEATFFAMTMGLSNFGRTLGEYLGVGLMEAFGLGIHQYDQLPEFILVRSLFRLLPLCLIPFLLPDGSPDSFQKKSTAEAVEEEEESIPLRNLASSPPPPNVVTSYL